MEPVILEDSPLAQYLEGEGAAEQETSNVDVQWQPTSSDDAQSFAPVRPDAATFRQGRRRPVRLPGLNTAVTTSAVSKMHQRCSSALHQHLGWTKKAHFLEQFRYIIVASQLLNGHPNPAAFARSPLPKPDGGKHELWRAGDNLSPSMAGILATAMSSFILVGIVKWTYNSFSLRWDLPSQAVSLACLVALTALAIFFVQRQRLHNLQDRAIESANVFVQNSQDFDSVAGSAITMIQDVEVVSRGYNISTPAPPVSRLEDQNQVKRCIRLRRTLRRSLDSILSPYFQAYESVRPFAIATDLEKYFDIYEISKTDLDEISALASFDLSDLEGREGLHELKIGIQKLHIVRKVFLCSLLALDAKIGRLDYAIWTAATDAMRTLSALTSELIANIDGIVREEEDFPLPPTPKIPLTPGKEQMRAQLRKVGTLSQGIRGLQAKMRLLREESDRALEASEDVLECRSSLLAQYDSIGNDLKDLTHEWEQGRAALSSVFSRSGHSRSVSCNLPPQPRSPALSLGGSTAVEGSPHPQNESGRSRSSTTSSSSGAEIFEGLGVPRPKSTMTREERIAKMKDDRLRQAESREKAHASTYMVRELETVLKHRPRGRTTGRMTYA